MSIADLIMTLTYLTESGMLESNPVARLIMTTQGVQGVVLWKLFTLALTGFILFVARRRLSAELGAVVCCAILGWLMVHWTTYNEEVHTITPILNGQYCTESLGWVSTAELQVGRTSPPPRRLVLRSEAWDEP